jgi:hypothetical protein
MIASTGSRIAAAWVGGTTSAIIGTPIVPSPPPKPPLLIPTIRRAGMAAA